MSTGELPSDLAADVQAAKALLPRERSAMYSEIEARRTSLEMTLARHQKASPRAGRTPDQIMAAAQKLHRAAQEGFEALREAEQLLPPDEAVQAAQNHLVELANEVAMGVWLGSVEAARDLLVAAVDRLITTQKAWYIADGGE